MAAYTTARSNIGFGAESTYGTAVARTVWRPFLEETLQEEVGRRDRDHHRTGDLSHLPTGDHKLQQGIEGDVLLEATYDNLGLLWRHAIGDVTTTGPSLSITLTAGFSAFASRV